MKTQYSQKWAVVAFFDQKPEGLLFHRSETPLHATLVGVFSYPKPLDNLLKTIESFCSKFEQFNITGKETAQWGDVRVTVLKASDKFNELYRLLQKNILEDGSVFNEPQYLFDGFTPHVTVQKEGSMNPGENWTIVQVALIDLFPDSDYTMRKVTKAWSLK